MLEPQAGMLVGEILEWAEYAEKAGVGYILRSDHLMPTGATREEDSPSPECWVTLGAVATSTRRSPSGRSSRRWGSGTPRSSPGWLAHSTHSPREGSFWDSGPGGSGMSIWRMATSSLHSGFASNNSSRRRTPCGPLPRGEE